jgi:[acyl-carrier-protein] S-malonyltransferase
MNHRLAIVFPGQGSQSVGMLADLAATRPVVRHTFDEASAVFGDDLWKMAQEGPEELIGRTEVTQPLMLAAGVATWRAYCDATDVRPTLLAGHSLGEYSAYVAAGTLSLADAVRVVKIRGELMRDACPGNTGKMAAVLGLDDEAIIAVCAQAAQGQVVQAVNFNAPGQVVIAGHNEAVDRAVILAREAGARKAMPLAVSVPCHSDLMKPASEKLQEVLSTITLLAPHTPVVNNVDAGVAFRPESILEKLVVQLYSPVRWVESIAGMATQGVDTFLECGPGKVLCGMNKRIAKGASLACIQDSASLAEAVAMVNGG